MPHVRSFLISCFWLVTACQSNSQTPPSGTAAPASADPPACDCCVFDKRHPTTWQARIAPDTAQGQPMRISGTVYESDGKTPARNVLMYFYHTNAQGRYAKLGTEPRLQSCLVAWLQPGVAKDQRKGAVSANHHPARPIPRPEYSGPHSFLRKSPHPENLLLPQRLCLCRRPAGDGLLLVSNGNGGGVSALRRGCTDQPERYADGAAGYPPVTPVRPGSGPIWLADWRQLSRI